MAIQLFVDSTAYLSKAHIETYGIKVLSLSVIFPDMTLLETEVAYDFFYEKLGVSKQLPTSSQPNIHLMTQAFQDTLEKGDDIIMIAISSEMSGTYQTALMVASQLLELYPHRRIEVIDSRSNCMQLGFQGLTAAQAIANDQTIEEIVQAVHHTREASRFIFAVDTLKYLEKGGRIGKASAMVGTILNIKPILTVNDGRTDTFGKVRSRHKAIAMIVAKVVEDTTLYGFKRACIHHINNPEGVQALKDALPETISHHIEVVPIGPVIGTHVGPGALGIVYQTEQPMTHGEVHHG